MNIQPNLVTKDGELQKELEKMKVLMARVREKIGGLPEAWEREREGEGEDVEMSEEGKLEAILERPPAISRGE